MRGSPRRSTSRSRAARRRRPKAEEEAERWDAFRRYLTDFPRLKEAPPATLELWERFLVYGIAFGIAERVLQGAQLHMPEELFQFPMVEPYPLDRAGMIHVPQKPGLGITIDWDAVDAATHRAFRLAA